MTMMSSGKFAFYLPICECKYKGAAAGGNNFSEGLLSPALSTAHGARSAAATELRRSRCCDGAEQTSSVALILRVASRRDALNEEPASFLGGPVSNFSFALNKYHVAFFLR